MVELYSFEFSLAESIVFGVLLLAFIHQVFYYFRFFNGILRQRTKIKNDRIDFTDEQPPVSVIICAKDESDNLRQFLPLVLSQDYPDFEVIVINDGSTDATDDLLKDLCKEYSNLRTTFVPVGANNISTKKLGLTLGIKAAKNDWLLFTDADCMPEDKTWIARMARNFTPETEFVLGYGAYFKKKGFINKLITYDTLLVAMQYMGMALVGKPYMGVGRNLAYRKETFFAQRGFASTLHLRSGDDDLIVNKASTDTNTRVEIAPDSITWSEPNRNYKDWFIQKERHLSVSSFYTSSSKFRLAIEPVFRGLFYLAFILTLVFGNLITQAVALLLFIIRLIVQYSVINPSAKHFGQRRFAFTLPIFDVLLPVIQLFIMTFGRMGSKAKNIHWK